MSNLIRMIHELVEFELTKTSDLCVKYIYYAASGFIFQRLTICMTDRAATDPAPQLKLRGLRLSKYVFYQIAQHTLPNDSR